MPHPPPQRQRGAAAARASLPVVLVLAVLLWGAAGVTAAAASTRNETAGQTCTGEWAAAGRRGAPVRRAHCGGAAHAPNATMPHDHPPLPAVPCLAAPCGARSC
jgi:hypothetical protein